MSTIGGKISEDILEGIRRSAEKLRDEKYLEMFYGKAVLSERTFHDLVRSSDNVPNPQQRQREVNDILGMQVRTSQLFDGKPEPCIRCDGAGSGGEESTYCQPCKGGGAIIRHGVMYNEAAISIFNRDHEAARVVMLVTYLPRKFEVSFPDVPVPLRKIPDRPTYVLQPAS